MWEKLKAPDTWVATFSLMAGAGIVCTIMGMLFRVRTVVWLGLALCAPLLAGALLLTLFVIPFVIIQNRR